MKLIFEGMNDNYARGTLEMQMVAKPAERSGWMEVAIEPLSDETDMEGTRMMVRARDLWALGEVAKTIVLDEGRTA